MGLDQYLYAERFISGYPDMDFEWNNKAAYDAIVSAAGLEKFTSTQSPHVDVRLTVAYWRKANAIHKWFVDHVQDGVDECQNSDPFGKEALEELVNLCKQALTEYEAGHPDAAAALLPPQGGFFFGSTEINDGYAYDLKITIEQLSPLLGDDSPEPFIYHSSW